MSPSPNEAARQGEAAAGRALNDRWGERLARAGILSRAINYIVLSLLIVAILVGRSSKEVDGRGAVEAIAGAPLGRALLLLLCLGFVAYIAWQLLRAGTRRKDKGDVGRRLISLVTALVYIAFLVTAVRVLVGSATKSPEGQQESLTAKLLGSSGGRLLLAAVGLGFVIAGLAFAGYSATRKFETPLDRGAMSRPMRRASTILGIAGQVARGLVFTMVGGFILSAAAAKDASRSKGLDSGLRTLAAQGFGATMLALMALGLLAFGLFSLVDARYRDDFTN